MATGELVKRHEHDSDSELGYGEARTANGRISVARKIVPEPPSVPFSSTQLARLDEALTLSSRDTGLDFSIYLGPLEPDPREAAQRMHAGLSTAGQAVLIAVSPQQRVVEVVTGGRAHRRIPDRACKLAVMSMVASFKEGDLIGGLISGLRMLSDQAGSRERP